jgi:redox-sensing transcriptional repressor
MKKISDSTINRLSKYYRTLSRLYEANITTISSEEIAEIDGVTAAQVRKDLSLFGTFGKRGLGYHTGDLREQIKRILGLFKEWNVAIIGVGNIGQALINYEEFKTQGFHIKLLVDNDPEKIGQKIKGIEIKPFTEIAKLLKLYNIQIAIIAVPAKIAQEVVDHLIHTGIKAILNFAPTSLKVPAGVMIKNENMSIELEALTYFLTNQH